MCDFLIWFAFASFGAALGWYFGFDFGYHAGWHEGRLRMLMGPAIKTQLTAMVSRKDKKNCAFDEETS